MRPKGKKENQMDLETLSDDGRKRFMHLCREGTEATSRALALLLNREAGLREVSSPVLVSPSEFAAMWGGPDTSLILIAFGLRGGIKGNLVQIFDQNSARAIINSVGATDEAESTFSERHFAILSEIGNISVSSFINEMMKSVQVPCIPTVPSLVYDGTDSAIRKVFGEPQRSWEDVPHPGFLMKTKFTQEPEIETALYLEIDSGALRDFLRQRSEA
jgi:chemotaxis protein CheY-P-specific phosphatase CheC